MKLDHSTESEWHGKYILINTRKLPDITNNVKGLITLIEAAPSAVEVGLKGTSEEFFPIKLKDKHAAAALKAYADSIRFEDPEFASEVDELFLRAGPNSPYCKAPD